eukprot:3029626-Rhodomonas_salina.1
MTEPASLRTHVGFERMLLGLCLGFAKQGGPAPDACTRTARKSPPGPPRCCLHPLQIASNASEHMTRRTCKDKCTSGGWKEGGSEESQRITSGNAPRRLWPVDRGDARGAAVAQDEVAGSVSRTL